MKIIKPEETSESNTTLVPDSTEACRDMEKTIKPEETPESNTTLVEILSPLPVKKIMKSDSITGSDNPEKKTEEDASKDASVMATKSIGSFTSKSSKKEEAAEFKLAEVNLSKTLHRSQEACEQTKDVTALLADEVPILKGESSCSQPKFNLNDFASVFDKFTLKDECSPQGSLAVRPRKKLVVLNLGGFLADIVFDRSRFYRAPLWANGRSIFKRPFCDEFLKFCFENFNVGIWSARLKANLDPFIECVFGEFKNELLFCWDQSKCTNTGKQTLEKRSKPLMVKELKKIWNAEEIGLPWKKGDFSPSNTLLVDDLPYVALLNPPHTAIFPHAYSYKDAGDNSFARGGDIRVYFEQLLMADDVQDYVKRHPFGQSAITASSPNWNFYSSIIRNHSTPLS